MTLESATVASAVAGIHSPFLVTLVSLLTLITIVTSCVTCCRKKIKKDSLEEAYGVINPTNATPEPTRHPPPPGVQFRTHGSKNTHDRHSQPTNAGTTAADGGSTRASAPPHQNRRALPQIPSSSNNHLYAEINKRGNGAKAPTAVSDVDYIDEPVNPMYESIDPENDSITDPLYTKVESRGGRTNRRYDYPMFTGANRERIGEDALYQSASQIYAAGSEDPYSSIGSTRGAGDEDSSSAYDPGYAKVKLGPDPTLSKGASPNEPSTSSRPPASHLEHLYSKIDRTGPSQNHVAFRDELDNIPESLASTADSQDGDTSREPSYRYMTVRESAEVVRERLRAQGQLPDSTRREHYYSTIGNEYETVGSGASSLYAGIPGGRTLQQTTDHGRPSVITLEDGASSSLSVTTATSTSTMNEFVPKPPTSPIPDHTPNISESGRIGRPSVLNEELSRQSWGSGGLQQRQQSPARVVSYPGNRQPSPGRSPLPPTVPPPSDSRMSSSFHEFMNRSSLPHPPVTPDHLLNRKVTEEREFIVESRSSVMSGSGSPDRESLLRRPLPDPSSSIMNTSTHSAQSNFSDSGERIHHVEIKRSDNPPSTMHPDLNHIIAGHGSNDSLDKSHHVDPRLQPGPCIPLEGEQNVTSPDGPPGSLRQSRSALPVYKDKDSLRKRSLEARRKRQESQEREGQPGPEIEPQKAMKIKSAREASEERMRLALGTIYTGNDYISPVDMSTDRSWPLVSDRSSPTENMKNGDSRNNNISELKQPLLSWELSSASEESLGGKTDHCDGAACYCHGPKPVNQRRVRKVNETEMKALRWGLPWPDSP